MSWWRRPRLQRNFLGENEIEQQKKNTSSTSAMGLDASDKCVFNVHALLVHGYAPPVLLHML